MGDYRQNFLDKGVVGTESKKIWKNCVENLVLMVGPFTPHIADEMWQLLGNSGYVFNQKWPSYVEELTKSDEINIAVQVNGKLRDTVTLQAGASKEDMEKAAFESSKVKSAVEGKEIAKVIVVPNKIVNIVVK